MAQKFYTPLAESVVSIMGVRNCTSDILVCSFVCLFVCLYVCLLLLGFFGGNGVGVFTRHQCIVSKYLVLLPPLARREGVSLRDKLRKSPGNSRGRFADKTRHSSIAWWGYLLGRGRGTRRYVRTPPSPWPRWRMWRHPIHYSIRAPRSSDRRSVRTRMPRTLPRQLEETNSPSKRCS